MTQAALALPAKTSGTELTRFNALRHGVLSRYTVLPWEDEAEYQETLSALVSEHRPSGPTEEHLVEELAGILWRKRRLRVAEAAAFRRGLADTSSTLLATASWAVAHLSASASRQDLVDAIQATAEDTADDYADLAADEAQTQQALAILEAGEDGAYEKALSVLRADTCERGRRLLLRRRSDPGCNHAGGAEVSTATRRSTRRRCADLQVRAHGP